MKFCRNCGKELTDKEKCDCQGENLSTGIKKSKKNIIIPICLLGIISLVIIIFIFSKKATVDSPLVSGDESENTNLENKIIESDKMLTVFNNDNGIAILKNGELEQVVGSVKYTISNDFSKLIYKDGNSIFYNNGETTERILSGSSYVGSVDLRWIAYVDLDNVLYKYNLETKEKVYVADNAEPVCINNNGVVAYKKTNISGASYIVDVNGNKTNPSYSQPVIILNDGTIISIYKKDGQYSEADGEFFYDTCDLYVGAELIKENINFYSLKFTLLENESSVIVTDENSTHIIEVGKKHISADICTQPLLYRTDRVDRSFYVEGSIYINETILNTDDIKNVRFFSDNTIYVYDGNDLSQFATNVSTFYSYGESILTLENKSIKYYENINDINSETKVLVSGITGFDRWQDKYCYIKNGKLYVASISGDIKETLVAENVESANFFGEDIYYFDNANIKTMYYYDIANNKKEKIIGAVYGWDYNNTNMRFIEIGKENTSKGVIEKYTAVKGKLIKTGEDLMAG